MDLNNHNLQKQKDYRNYNSTYKELVKMENKQYKVTISSMMH